MAHVIKDNAELSKRIHNALQVAEFYGQEDGANHKMWVIDRMVRALLGSNDTHHDPATNEYNEWVHNYETYYGEYEEPQFKWHAGVAP